MGWEGILIEFISYACGSGVLDEYYVPQVCPCLPWRSSILCVRVVHSGPVRCHAGIGIHGILGRFGWP